MSTCTVRPVTPAGLALFLVLVGTGCPQPSAPPPTAPPRLPGALAGRDVVLITVDTVRADRLGAYGSTRPDVSPAIDALLAEGIRFDRATAPRAVTWPSLTTVLTGLYPSGHGVLENGYQLADGVAALPQLLQQAGYRTAAFLSNMCEARVPGLEDRACSGGQDGKTVERALAWAGEAQRDTPGAARKPYFLWVHLFAAHGPYYNGGSRAQELDPGYTGPLAPKKWALDRVMAERLALSDADVRHLDALYDAAVMGTDGHVGRLLAGLGLAGPTAPQRERTLTVFLADHGEELYDHHGYLYHACTPYQTGLHVPLGLVAAGVLPAGGVVPQVVELADVFPTLLDLLGLPAPPEVHGVSLLPLLGRRGTAADPRDFGTKPAFSEYSGLPIRTVQSGSWKLIENPTGLVPHCIEGVPPGLFTLEKAELYDLATDPAETHNLAAANPAKVAELTALLTKRYAGLQSRGGRQQIDPELKKQLEALGYVVN